MRRPSLVFSAALISLCGLSACSEENLVPEEPSQEVITLTAEVPQWGLEGTTAEEIEPVTKTVRTSEGSTYWLPYDKINVFQGASESSKFTSMNSEPAQITQFVGTLTAVTGTSYASTASTDFWGIYPYDASNTCDGNSVTLTVHDVQESVAASFASGEFPSIGRSHILTLSFFNVCGGIYFSVTHAGITSITVAGQNNEILAGTVKVGFDSTERPTVQSVIDGKTSVTINAPDRNGFVPGTRYYMAVLPNSFPNGMTMTFNMLQQNASGVEETLQGVYIHNKEFTINRSVFSGFSNRDANIEFTPVQSQTTTSMPASNEIYYTSDYDYQVYPFDESAFGNATITANRYRNGLGTITFDQPLTEISGYAFFECAHLTSITLPEGVESIGDAAFSKCTSLTSIDIPSSVQSIGGNAFLNCSSLESIALPSGLVSIGNQAFSGCSSIESLAIPKNVTSIGGSAFQNCSGLTTMVLPEGLSEIEDQTFMGCSGLVGVRMTDGISSIGKRAFAGCSSLVSISVPSGVTGIGNEAFDGCTALESAILPPTVSEIGSAAFRDCSSLGSIFIPEGVTVVDEETFSGCLELGTVAIPPGIESIEASAFESCSSLVSVSVPEGAVSLGDRAFGYCTSLASLSLPESLESMGDEVFMGCEALTSVDIPDGISSIGEAAFSDCTLLASVDIPASVSTIGDYAFQGCLGLVSIEVPEGIATIGDGAFLWCLYLESVSLPSTVTSIGEMAFAGCLSLATVDIDAVVPPALGVNAFQYASPAIHVPSTNARRAYQAAAGWSGYSDFIIAS